MRVVPCLPPWTRPSLRVQGPCGTRPPPPPWTGTFHPWSPPPAWRCSCRTRWVGAGLCGWVVLQPLPGGVPCVLPTAPSLLSVFVLPVRLVSCDAPCLLDVMHPPPHAHAHAHAHKRACADLHLRSPGRSAWHHQGGCCQDCGANVAVGQRAVVCVVGGGRMVGEGGAYPGKGGLEAQCPSVAFCEHCPCSVHGATTPANSLFVCLVW